VNDGAYTTLCGKGGHVPLIEIAKDYPELEWAEMLSVSKAFSDPGARLGVLVGSAAFVEDFILIKGNTESGPVPSIMAAYAELFKDRGLTRRLMDELYQIYQARLDYLVPKLKSLGLEPACETTAGFFTLWKTPDRAYGFDLHEESKKRGMTRSELFNRLVIERAGVVGVHFQGAPGTEESFIRYAVCTDVLSSEFQTRFEQATQGMGLAYK
jgi:aspartate/methionine/tyrosine aminotransferase